MTVIDAPPPVADPVAPPVVHEGEQPDLFDAEADRVCHLLAGNVPLCGAPAGSWGIPEDSEESGQSPCTCGMRRCPDCLEWVSP